MCTVTIVPTSAGFRVTCNRDERRTRPAALPPRLHTTGALRSIFPIDPQGGGTWIGVNEAGVVAALLNRNDPRAAIEWRQPPKSRGLIVPRLLEHLSLDSALGAAHGTDPKAFAPFMVILAQGTTCGMVTSDGISVSVIRQPLRRPVMFTSSSLGDGRVRLARQILFDRFVLTKSDVTGWLEGQRRFHRHRWRARPEISVLMTRQDARTVSRTVVDVSDRSITLRYRPLVDKTAAGALFLGSAA